MDYVQNSYLPAAGGLSCAMQDVGPHGGIPARSCRGTSVGTAGEDEQDVGGKERSGEWVL